MPVHELQMLAGHASITTTQRYMNARANSLAESMRRQALDVLDWCTDDQIPGMRDGLSWTLTAWKCSLAAGPSPSSTVPPASAWDPVQTAMFFVIWQTSHEYLEACFNRRKRDRLKRRALAHQSPPVHMLPGRRDDQCQFGVEDHGGLPFGPRRRHRGSTYDQQGGGDRRRLRASRREADLCLVDSLRNAGCGPRGHRVF